VESKIAFKCSVLDERYLEPKKWLNETLPRDKNAAR